MKEFHGVKKIILPALFLAISSEAFAAGNIEITTFPQSAAVYIEYIKENHDSDSIFSFKIQNPKYLHGPAYAGQSPLFASQVGSGNFKIYVVKEGYETKVVEVEVENKKTRQINIELEKGESRPVAEIPAYSYETDTEKHTIILRMLNDGKPVPVFSNVSEVLIQTETGLIIITREQIQSGTTPDFFSGTESTLEYRINTLKGKWYVIAQQDNQDDFELELTVLDSNKNKVFTTEEKGSYNIVSAFSWEVQ